MQTYCRYTLPALVLVLLLSAAVDGYSQPASSATIQATATVAAPIGVASHPILSDDYVARAPGLYVLCPAEAHVLVTVNESGSPVHSRHLSDLSVSTDTESGRPALRVLDCSHLSPLNLDNSTDVVTVIVTEN